MGALDSEMSESKGEHLEASVSESSSDFLQSARTESRPADLETHSTHHLACSTHPICLEPQPLTLHIQNLALEVIIGILPHEREKPQKVLLECHISYLYTPSSQALESSSATQHAPLEADPHAFLNYAEICELLSHELAHKGYGLLESALLDLSQILKRRFPQILRLKLKITKPDILAPTIVGASLEMEF